MKENPSKLLSKEFMECLFSFNRNFFCQQTLPLPVNHFITLVSLYEHSHLTISSLSKRLNVSKQQMTPIIDKLLKSGYVDKQELPEDRRCSSISLTNKGYSLLQKHHNEHAENFEQLISVLSPCEIKDFEHSLNTLKKMFQKMFSSTSR